MDLQGKNEKIVSQIQNGIGDRQELLSELWTCNLGLVQKIIHRCTGLQKDIDRQDFEDLEQQAFIGIMCAMQKYDPAAGVRFFTYAESYIKKSIYKYYDRNGQALRLPAYMRKRIRQYTQARESLRMKGKAASIENIQELLSWSDNAMHSVVETIRKAEMQSLDCNLNENEKYSVTVLDMIAASENVEEDALSGSYLEGLHSLLQLALGELPNRERTVLQALFFQGLSYKELADCFGCTKQNISKIKGDAYKNIRMGKYGSELLSYLPDRKAKRAKKRIDQDFKELSEDERDLLL